MSTLPSPLVPHAAVLTTALPNAGVVLLHLQTSRYYSLNATGAQIWQGLQAQWPVGQICQALVERYAITPAEAATAVDTLLAELRAAALVQATPA